ncbi:hypothetical protein [Candidatus Poriferisodalis sp.]|uniref:hypothetical protein n=1 Tax=Candidatus Poriferisodalis sp. TaxID=3101277 RepID=UPI003B013350
MPTQRRQSLSDAPLSGGKCISVLSGVFVAPRPADDTSGGTRCSEAANRPGGVAIDADLQGERGVLGTACRSHSRPPGTSLIVEADSVSSPQREQELRP